MKYAKDKTAMLHLRFTPLQMATLDALAKDRGVTSSEMLRIILEDIVKKGSVNWDSGKVKLVTDEMMTEE